MLMDAFSLEMISELKFQLELKNEQCCPTCLYDEIIQGGSKNLSC